MIKIHSLLYSVKCPMYIHLCSTLSPSMSFDDIRRIFTQREYDVDSYIEYSHGYAATGRCHVYSFPSNLERIQYILTM